jgi:hypothetical protein
MALPLANSFEGGTSGTTITTGNSGGASGNAFDSIAIGTSCTCAFSALSVHGSFSMSVSTAGTAAQTYAQWSTALGSQTALFGRSLIYLTGAPASNEVITQFLNTSTVLSNLRLLTSRLLQVGDSVGGAVFTFVTAIPLNQWVRVEWSYTFPGSATGQVTVKLFLSPDGLTPDESQTSAASQNFGSLACNTVRFGWLQAVANSPAARFDSLAVNATAFPGAVMIPYYRPTTSHPGNRPRRVLNRHTPLATTSGDVVAYAGVAEGQGFAYGTGSRTFLLLALTQHDAPVGITALPDASAGTGEAFDAVVTTSGGTVANAEAAEGTGTAFGPTVDIGALPNTPAGTGVALDATAGVTTLPDTPVGTGVAQQPVIDIGAAPSTASGTGTAFADDRIDIVVQGTEVSTGTGTAQQPVTDVGASPGTASGAGSAFDAGIALGILSEAATATGTAFDATPGITVFPDWGAGTGTAFDAVVTTSGSTVAQAEAALGTGTAFDAVADVGALPGTANATGAALGPVPDVGATPPSATGVGTAEDASVALVIQGTGVATGVGTANTLAPDVGALAGVATGTGTSLDASVGIVVIPDVAIGTGTAYDATATLPQAGTPTVISGREGQSLYSGREPTILANGQETGSIYGRQPLSSTSGTEPETSISGREPHE